MSDLYSRVAMQKKFQGRELSGAIKKGAGNLAGQKLDNIGARKVLTETLAYKSKDARDRILKKMGLDYKERNKFEQDTFGAKKVSSAELRKIKEKELKRIKYNIAMSVKAGDQDYNNLVGQRVGSAGKVRRSFYAGAKKEYGHMSMSDRSVHSASIGSKSTLSNLSFRNVSSLATDKNANRVAGGFGAKNSAAPGMGRGGVIRPMGMGRLQ